MADHPPSHNGNFFCELSLTWGNDFRDGMDDFGSQLDQYEQIGQIWVWQKKTTKSGQRRLATLVCLLPQSPVQHP